MERINLEPSPSLCVTTASALAALVAAVAATAIATAAAVAVISGSGAGSSLGCAIFIAAVLAAAASGLLAACIAGPSPAEKPPAIILPESNERQIVLPLTTIEDGLKTLVHITKSHQPRPTRRRPSKKRYVYEDPHQIPPPIPPQIPPPILPSSSSVAFHERCGHILQTCDRLIRHFPTTRTLCILRTADGILARRPPRPVDPEPTGESDIDIDLDPVLSAPDLDEALRRLDQRIRSARKYKERNVRLQSTSLVLEAEKRRAIRSSAEQYLVDDDLPANTPSEQLPVDSNVSVDAAKYYPKPKARSSVLQFCPTDSSHHLPTPGTNETRSESTSPTSFPSTEAGKTGFTSSRHDVTSSIVEMNSELCSAADSSVRNESEIFSSFSLEKETENAAFSPSLTLGTSTSPCVELEPKILHNQSSSSTSAINESQDLIESKNAPSNLTQIEERLQLIEGTETPPPEWTSFNTSIGDAPSADIPLVAELSEDVESQNWSSIVQVVAYGLPHDVPVSLRSSIESEDSALPLPKDEAGTTYSVCEKTGVSLLPETVMLSVALVDTQDTILPLTTSGAVSSSSGCDETKASLLSKVLSPSLVESEEPSLLLTTRESVSSSYLNEKIADSVLPKKISPSDTVDVMSEESLLPSTNIEAVSTSYAHEKTGSTLLADTVSSPSALVDIEESSHCLTTREVASSTSICDEIGTILLHEIDSPSPTLVECSLPVINSEAVTRLVLDKSNGSSAEMVSSLGAELPNNAPHSFQNPQEDSAMTCLTEKNGPDAVTNKDSTSPVFISNNETTTKDSSTSHGNDTATTHDEAASAVSQHGSLTDSETKDFGVDYVETTDRDDLLTLSETDRNVKSTLTLDLRSIGPSEVELEFEQLLENISPPTDIEKAFIAVSSGISEQNETVSDERAERINTNITASTKDDNEVTRFSCHVVEPAMEQASLKENDPEILISDGGSKLSLSDETPHGIPFNESMGLQSHSVASFDKSNETGIENTNQVSSRHNESFATTAVPALVFEDNVKCITDNFSEAEFKFDREIQSYDVNLGAEAMSDGASDSSSMSVSPNPDISFLRTETNLARASSPGTIKDHLPPEKKDLPKQTMDDFGFGEPLMVVTARKVTTYVDDTLSSSRRNFRQKRRVRISAEDFDPGDVSESQERKIGLVRPSTEQRGQSARQFAPVRREICPPEINTCKPLKPEAMRPFGGRVRVTGGPSSDVPPGHCYRSLERKEDARLPAFDHSSSFPLSMRVPHRRAFWDYKLNEPKIESTKRQESMTVTGIVQKCKETFQNIPSLPDGSSPLTIDEGDLPENHRRRFQEARCFFQNLAGGSKEKIPAEPDSPVTVMPRQRAHPATVAERFNVTGIYQDVLGDGAAKTASGAPLRGVPRRKAVVATLHSFRK